MAHRPRGRRTNATGRSDGEAQHVRLYRWELTSPAYRSLSIGARALLVELKALYNGNNNGELFLSTREASRRLNRQNGRNQAARLFAELEDRGFIRARSRGDFKVKSGVMVGRATCWILTEFPFGGALPTKDFMRWQSGVEKKKAVTPECPPGHASVTLDANVTRFPGQLVTPACPVKPNQLPNRSRQRDTDNLPREVA